MKAQTHVRPSVCEAVSSFEATGAEAGESLQKVKKTLRRCQAFTACRANFVEFQRPEFATLRVHLACARSSVSPT